MTLNMTMHESMLIVPKRDNAGKDLTGLTRNIEAELVAAFGGCTARDATGLWDNAGKLYNEPVTELVAACPDNDASNATLRRLALDIDRRGNQLCAYCRFPDSHVELIPANNNRAQAA